MSAPLSQRLFGITGNDPSSTVEGLVERLRKETLEGGQRVIVARCDDTVADAYKLFESFDLHHLPIVEGARVVGVVSSTDLVKFFANEGLMDPEDAPLADIMTKNPETIRKSAPIRDVIKVLAHSKFRCLPVLNEQDEIWDIVTTRDLVRFLELEYGS